MYVPDPSRVADANIHRLAARLGVPVDQLRDYAIADPQGFWMGLSADFGPRWTKPYDAVCTEAPAPEKQWFVGGMMNLAAWAMREDLPGMDVVLRWIREDGEKSALTRADLRRAIGWNADRFRQAGIRPQDRVAMSFAPHWSAVCALLGCLAAGGVPVLIFSGYGVPAFIERIRACGPKLILLQDSTLRKGEVEPIAAKFIDAARDAAPGVPVHILATQPFSSTGGNLWPAEIMLTEHVEFAPVPAASAAPALVLFTSGSSGPPKGVVLSNAGFAHQAALEWQIHLDLRRGDEVCWPADLGWVVGPWAVLGVIAGGGTLTLLEGIPLEALAKAGHLEHISILGGSPSFHSSLIAHSKLRRSLRPRIIGAAGEPFSPNRWTEVFAVLGRSAIPIINFCGGTEVGTSIMAGLVTDVIAPGSFGGPALGMDADVVDDAGLPVRGSPGHLICRSDWPGRAVAIFNNEGGLARYFERFGAWCQNDLAVRTSGDQWFVLGRSDEVMKIGGRRIGPSEIENAAVVVPDVTACVSIPVTIEGHSMLACVVECPKAEVAAIRQAVSAALEAHLGRPFRPLWVGVLPNFPKLQTGKYDRAALRNSLTAAVAEANSGLDAAARLEAWATASTPVGPVAKSDAEEPTHA